MLLLILLVVAGAGLGHLQTEYRKQGRFDPLSSILQHLIAPLANPLALAIDSVGDFGAGMMHARALAQENRLLKMQLAASAIYTEQMDLAEQRIEQLRTELGLPALSGRDRINLDVIGISQTEGQLTLNGGEERGILPGMPVVNGDGLVGVVQVASKGISRVALLTSFGLKYGGLDVSRKPPEMGLISGAGTAILSIEMFDPKSPIASGDLIETTGASAQIPAGIPIGKVISVDDDPNKGTRMATIEPAMNPGTLHEVQVLK